MGELGDCFSNLHQINVDFNQKCPFGKDVVQEKIYFCLQNSFTCWSEVTNNQLKHVDLHMNKYFDYHLAEMEQIKDVI
jgi:hypothetical protein